MSKGSKCGALRTSGASWVEVRRRGAVHTRRSTCGWCPERTHSSCRLLGDPKGQWMHVSGFTSHNRKHHNVMPAEQQGVHKLFVQDDDAHCIEGCARCAEGFWQKQDLDLHGPPCAGKATQHTQCSSATQQLLCSTASLLHFTCCVALLHCVCCVASMADVCCCRALGTTMMSTTRSRRGKGVRASPVQRT